MNIITNASVSCTIAQFEYLLSDAELNYYLSTSVSGNVGIDGYLCKIKGQISNRQKLQEIL